MRRSPAYQKARGVSGNLNSVGSDTMNNMMTLWAEAFRKLYPNVKIQIEGKGSSHGAARAHRRHRAVRPDVARRCARPRSTSSRRSTATSRRSSARRYDALAVYVNKDNPLEKLTLAQVDAIFSKTRRRGGKNVKTWGHLGLTGDWAGRPISLYGRNSASRHLRLLQGARAEERRLQGHGQGAAGLGLGRPGRHRGPLRHRLQRHRLQDLRRQGRSRSPRRTPFFERQLRGRDERQVPALALPLHLRQQGAGQAARPAGQGVR